MKVIWAPLAKRELREGLKYIRQRDRAAADRIAARMRKSVARIARLPKSGNWDDEVPEGVRFIVVEPFVLYYIVCDNAITIIRTRHGSQDFPPSFEL